MKKIIILVVIILDIILLAGCADNNENKKAVENNNHTALEMEKADNAFLEEYPKFIQDMNGNNVPLENISTQAKENIKSIIAILSGRKGINAENGIGILYNVDIAKVFVKTIYMQVDESSMNYLFAYEYLDKPAAEFEKEIIRIFGEETKNTDLMNALRVMTASQDSIAKFSQMYLDKLTNGEIKENIRSNMFYLSCSFVTYLKEQKLPADEKILSSLVDMFFRVSSGASNISSFDKPVLGATYDETFSVMPVISPDKNYNTLIQFVQVCDKIINPYTSNPDIAGDETGVPVYDYIEIMLPKLIVNYLSLRPAELNMVSQRAENRLLELYRLMIKYGAKEISGTIEELSTPLQYSYAQTVGRYLKNMNITYEDCDTDAESFKLHVLDRLENEVSFKDMIEEYNNL